jgi:hypothetical protein
MDEAESSGKNSFTHGDYSSNFGQMSATRVLSCDKSFIDADHTDFEKSEEHLVFECVYLGPFPRYSLQVMAICRGQRNLATDEIRTRSVQPFRR